MTLLYGRSCITFCLFVLVEWTVGKVIVENVDWICAGRQGLVYIKPLNLFQFDVFFFQ